MAARKRISAPGRSGNSKRNSRSSRASSLRPPTMWRTCSLASSSSVRSTLAKPCCSKWRAMRPASSRRPMLSADEDMRHALVGDAVVELGHRARTDELAEALERAALLGDRHREQRLALLAELGALGDEAQAVEVHVRAAGDGHQRLPLELVRLDVLLDRRHAQRAGRLEDAARVLEHVLDGGADGVGVDDHEVVDQRAA